LIKRRRFAAIPHPYHWAAIARRYFANHLPPVLTDRERWYGCAVATRGRRNRTSSAPWHITGED
jgi:hypothetical protein